MHAFAHPAPTDEPSFQRFMEAIDRHFADLGMPIPARQLAAIAEAGHALGETHSVPAHREPVPGVYTGPDLLLRAIAWYDQRYGDRLKVYCGPGRGLVMLRGEPWAIEYPTVLGSAGFQAGNDPWAPRVVYTAEAKYVSVTADSSEWITPGLTKIDVLDHIQGLPLGLRANLHHGELTGCLVVFCTNRLFLHTLVMARRHRFVEEARADLENAVANIVARPPMTGQAKWSCMHAVEKVFKSLLFHAGKDFPKRGPKGHDISHLYQLVNAATGLVLSAELLDETRCVASLRYDSSQATVSEAVRAHFAAVELAASAALVLRHDFPLMEV